VSILNKNANINYLINFLNCHFRIICTCNCVVFLVKTVFYDHCKVTQNRIGNIREQNSFTLVHTANVANETFENGCAP